MSFGSKYNDYQTTLTYNGTARESLRRRLYDTWETLEMESNFTAHKMYRFNRLPLYNHFSDDEYKMKFFMTAAFLCYIPYDTEGYEYIKQEWLGGESVVEYRYKNVMNKLKYMGILLDEEDSQNLRYVFEAQESTVFRLDAAGIAALALRVRTALEGESFSKHNNVASLSLSKAISAKIEKTEKLILSMKENRELFNEKSKLSMSVAALEMNIVSLGERSLFEKSSAKAL